MAACSHTERLPAELSALPLTLPAGVGEADLGVAVWSHSGRHHGVVMPLFAYHYGVTDVLGWQAPLIFSIGGPVFGDLELNASTGISGFELHSGVLGAAPSDPRLPRPKSGGVTLYLSSVLRARLPLSAALSLRGAVAHTLGAFGNLSASHELGGSVAAILDATGWLGLGLGAGVSTVLGESSGDAPLSLRIGWAGYPASLLTFKLSDVFDVFGDFGVILELRDGTTTIGGGAGVAAKFE